MIMYSTQNGTGYEYATDLGTLYSLGLSSSPTLNDIGGAYTGGPQNIHTSNFGVLPGQTNFSNMYVTYFIAGAALNRGNGAAWTSGALSNSGFANANNAAGFFNATEVPMALWASEGTISVSNAQIEPTASSFWVNAETSGATIGTFQGFLNTSHGKLGSEANLTALNTTGGAVDQLLYYYGSNLNAGGQGTVVAELVTNADGSTTLEAAPVPIPAAVYLFGSGLLGMFGLRRKMTA